MTDWTERFWSKVEKTDGCWEWTARAKHGFGYGAFRLPGPVRRTRQAHVLSFLLAYGPYDRRLQVRHRCDNPPCVRPDHLELGTAKDNSRDMVERGRACFGERQGTSKLTEGEVRAIRARVAAGAVQRHLAAEYGVSVAQVSRIVSGKRWGHLKEVA